MAYRFLVIPCALVIEWILTHMDDSHLVLYSESGGQLATYCREDMQTYYKMPRPTKYANNNFYTRWANLNISDIIKS